MERILIEDENRNIVIDIQDKALKGCSFYNDGKIKSLNKEDLNIRICSTPWFFTLSSI